MKIGNIFLHVSSYISLVKFSRETQLTKTNVTYLIILKRNLQDDPLKVFHFFLLERQLHNLLNQSVCSYFTSYE